MSTNFNVVRISQPAKEAVEKIAAKERRSTANMLTLIVEDYMQRHYPKVKIDTEARSWTPRQKVS